MQKWLGILAVTFCALPLGAATFYGTIKSVDSDSRTLVVDGSKSAGTKTFEVPEKAAITVSGTRNDFEVLTEGANVSVTTDSANRVTRVNVKAAAASESATARSKSKTPASKSESATPGAAATAQDWPYFCGTTFDNIAADSGLLKEWPADGPPLSWRADSLGEGYSSVSIADGLVFTMGNFKNSETVTALELETGKQVWQQRMSAASKLQMGDGPRGTPTYDEGRLYCLGGNGDLAALDARTGKQFWKKNILKEFGGNNITWGISESVLIDGDKLICTPGGSNGTIVALNKKTGKVIWRCVVPGKSPAGYSSAIVAETGGVRQYIQFLHAGVAGVRADNGEFLWGNDDSANGTANCSSPLFADDMVFSSSGYGKGGALLKLSAKGKKVSATHVYHTNKMESHHGGLVLRDGYVYGSSDPGIVRCLELATGKVQWENRSVGKGAITCADGYLIVRSEQGPIALVEATPEAYRETGRFDQPDRSGAMAWAHPVVAHGKLFIRDQDLLLVYDVKAR